MTTDRPLSVIAAEIAADWRPVWFGAVPYLRAMLELDATGLARWKDQEMFTTIVQRIKESGATDDYVRTVLADGNAKFLSESHFRWDGALQTLTVTREGVPPVVYGPTTVLQK